MANSATVGILRVLLTGNSAEFETAMKRAADSARTWSRDLNQIGRQASQVGQALTKTLTLPIIAAGAGAAKAAIDFESSFAGVRKTVQATEPEFAAMAQAFRNLAKDIPVNVNELNRLGEAAGALGIPKKEIVDFARVMAMLGVTTNVTSDQAAESIAKIQTVFQASGKDTENFASTLVDLGNKGASTEAEILELANRIASAGRAVGMSQANVLGFASAIANVGIEAEAGGSAISKVFADLSIAVSHGGDTLDAFAKIAGMSSAAFAQSFRDDAAQAVTTFIEGLGRAQAAGGDLNLILESLGFSEIRQARALRDLALSGDNLSKSLRIAGDAWRAQSALSDEAQERFKTTESRLSLLWNRIKDVGITIGIALLPAINSAITLTTALVPLVDALGRAFGSLPGPVQGIVIGLGLVGAAAGPAIWAMGQLALSAGAITGAFTQKGIAMRAIAALVPGLTTGLTGMGVAAGGAAIAVRGLQAAFAGFGIGALIVGISILVERIRNIGQEVEDLTGKPIKGLVDGTGRALMSLDEAKAKVAQLSGLLHPLGIGLTVVAGGMDRGAPAAKTYADRLADVQRVIAGLTAAQRAHIVDGDKFGDSAKEIAESLKLTGVDAKIAEIAVRMFLDTVKTGAKTFADTGKEYRALWNEIGLRRMEDEAAELASIERRAQYWRDVYFEERRRQEDEALAAQAAIVYPRFDPKKFLEPFKAAVRPDTPEVRSLGGSIVKGIGDTFKEQFGPTILAAITGGGNIGKAIGALLGQSIGQSLADGVAKKFGDSFLSKAVQSVLPGVGALLGSLLGKIGAIPKEVLEQRKQLEDFQRTLRDRLSEDQRREAGNAQWKMDIIAVRDAYAQLGLTAEQAMADVAAMWATDSPQRSAAAIERITASFERLSKLQNQAGGIFDQLMAFAAEHGGVPESMRALIEQFIQLGLLTDEQAAKLRNLGDSGAIDVGKMEEALGVFNGRVDQMGQAFQQAKIDQTAKRYINAIETLVDGGMEWGAALFDAREEISALVRDSLKFGTTIPANMKPWIEDLLRSGNLLDENGNAITDISGIKWGEAMKTQTEIAEEGWKTIADLIRELIDSITNGLAGAIDKVPKNIRIDGEVIWRENPDDIRLPGGHRDFPAGALALGAAAFVPPMLPSFDLPSMLDRPFDAMTPAMAMSNASASIGDIHVHVSAAPGTNGQQLAEQLADTLRYDPRIRRRIAALTSLGPTGPYGY